MACLLTRTLQRIPLRHNQLRRGPEVQLTSLVWLHSCQRLHGGQAGLFQKATNTESPTSLPEAAAQGKKAEEAKDFLPVFRFPYIRHASVVCRLKLYQTGLTLVLVPANALLYALDFPGVTPAQCVTSLAIATLACSILYVIGGFFSRLVGVVYFEKEEEDEEGAVGNRKSKGTKVIKVSHLTFWGNRRDLVVSLADVVPFDECSGNPKNVYHNFRLYSDPQFRLYYITRFGGVLRPDLFEVIFGDSVAAVLPRDRVADPEDQATSSTSLGKAKAK